MNIDPKTAKFTPCNPETSPDRLPPPMSGSVSGTLTCPPFSLPSDAMTYEAVVVIDDGVILRGEGKTPAEALASLKSVVPPDHRP